MSMYLSLRVLIAGVVVKLPLELKHCNLSKLCKQHVPNALQDGVYWYDPVHEQYEPSIGEIPMRLRRLPGLKGTLKVEAIQCGQRYALIGAGDRLKCYVLKEDDRDPGVYNIHNEFQRDRTSSENIEIHIQEVKADINKADWFAISLSSYFSTHPRNKKTLDPEINSKKKWK